MNTPAKNTRKTRTRSKKGEFNPVGGQRAELRASEERNRQLLQQCNVAMIVTRGLEQRNEFVNDRFTALFGYTIEDVPDVAHWWRLAYPDEVYREVVKAEWQARVEKALNSGIDIEPMEATVRCKDGAFRYIEARLSCIGETSVVTLVDLTARKRAEESLASVSRKLVEAQEQERTRIARDLHDDIGQRLALVSNGLEELKLNSDLPAEVSGRIGKLQGETSQIATDIQSLSHELHSSKLDLLGIAVAIKGFCREVGEQQHVEVICETHDLPGNLPPAIALCLFRVLQEALRNSIKHSGVKQVEVRSWGTPKEIHLTIRDSGLGFELKAARNSRGLGLVSMEERLKLVQGTLSIDSEARRGTTIRARVPLSP